ncbi:hypothetical protein HPB47_005865 [Ixodes persulcatus]|uniref:Uncharacterized protein n=1 Tax=Ixodes persulcatus TaxID=34615 RepID=A0AC60PC39_IXOPE|nr:hypothetical protein HPB47_005865 [Ixodes persulcatus]
MYAYSIRIGYLPQEVVTLLGGFPPSTGHDKRLCKLVRSETLKQVERYRDCLKVMCFERASDQPAAERSFASHLQSAEQMTEFLWRRQLTVLPKKRSTSKMKQGGVTFLGGATLPEDTKATLERGPKFAVEPKLPPLAKLSMVRAMADRALPQDRERFISDGVDALCRTAGHRPKSLKMGAAVEHLKNNSLKLLTSDKEGGFAVLPHDLYAAKAREAVAKNFKVVKPGSLNKAKLRAKELCSEMDLSVLAKKVNASATIVHEAAELAEQQRHFYVGDGFLDVVIAIYGTYARIQKSLLHEEVSANRHFYHSINVQLMLHARSGILNVVSKWPVSVYDSYVLSQSSVQETFAADTAASSSATSATCAGRG